MTTQTTVVEITFKRLQQFLFAVPRLKAMTGANACLGETIREDLLKAVEKYKPKSIHEHEVSPPGSTDHDPISEYDNPAELYEKGIISRDGGHFTAAFKSKNDAENFIKAASQLVATKLPGVQIETTIKEHGKENTDKPQNNATGWGKSPVRLPQFMLCEDTGNIANIKRKETPNHISSIVENLENAGTRFNDGKTNDIIGRLKQANKLPGYDDEKKIPQDLSDLAGSRGYIAVIHADGNSIGSRRKNSVGTPNHSDTFDFNRYIQHEVKNETFFHAMRTAMRASVVDALECVFSDKQLEIYYEKNDTSPYHLLMLGGDDLLLITRPEFAFPFTINLARQLKQYKLPGGEPVSIGAGIVIAHHNVPFYHLHHLAENLAGSAKKLFRQQQQQHSVVDWMLSTNSWIDNIEETRRLYDLHEDGTHCISAKPYFVLDDAAKTHGLTSLQTLWKAACEVQKEIKENKNKSDEKKLPRSKLKGLLQYITAFNRDRSKEHYKSIDPLPGRLKALFGESGESLWHHSDDKYLTHYKDLMELIELHYLGRSEAGEKSDNKNDETGEGQDNG